MISLNNIVTTDEITDGAVTNDKIANSTIDLATKASTLTGLTLTDPIINTYPFQYQWLMSNYPANTTRALPPLSGASNAAGALVAPVKGQIKGFSLIVRSVDYGGTEGTHAETGYAGWTTGTITLFIQTTNGTDAHSTVLTLVSGLTKANVAAYTGRMCKWVVTAVTPVDIAASTEIICKATTSSGFDGTALDMVITLYGRLSDVP